MWLWSALNNKTDRIHSVTSAGGQSERLTIWTGAACQPMMAVLYKWNDICYNGIDNVHEMLQWEWCETTWNESLKGCIACALVSGTLNTYVAACWHYTFTSLHTCPDFVQHYNVSPSEVVHVTFSIMSSNNKALNICS